MKSTKVKLEEARDREAVARRLLREWAVAFASAEEDSKNAVEAEASLALAAGTFTNARHARKRLEKRLANDTAESEADRRGLTGWSRSAFLQKHGAK